MTLRNELQAAARCARRFTLVATATVAIALSGCGGKSDDVDPGADSVKLDTFCTIDGLAPALRHTVIVVDTSALVNAAPEEFRTKNPELFKLIVSLADPAVAIESGAAAPRERITILAGSPQGGALTPIFTGCLPGASAAELVERESHGSGGAVKQYFGSDLKATIGKDQAAFKRQVLLALMRLDRAAAVKPAGGSSDFTGSALVKLLKPLGPPTSDDGSVRRLFVFDDLSRSLPSNLTDVATARAAGFKAAQDAGLRLGLADVYLVSANVPDDLSEQFLSAFVLGSQGKLSHAGVFSANGLEAAPTQVVNYRGVLSATRELTMPMTLRLTATRDGQLVSSWISYTASFGQRATPVSGQFTCSADLQCELRSDPEGGLGQLWRIKPGAEPEVREDAPFGGLRFLEAKETSQALQGRIYDPVISIGHPGGGMSFSAKRIKN